MAPQCFEAIAGTSPDSRTVCRVHGCNIHVTLAPEAIYGNVDYYKDPKQNVEGSGFRSRHYDFIARHQDCGHTVPDYYADYGDKFVRLMTDRLFPQLSEKGKLWLKQARRKLQEYMEKGFKQNKKSTHIFITPKSNVYKKSEYSNAVNSRLTIDVKTPEGIETLELDPDRFRHFAFQTHPLAYVMGGFHTMETGDYLKIIRFFGGDAVQDYWQHGKLPSREMGAQIVAIAKDILANHKLDYLEKGVDSVKYVGESIIRDSTPTPPKGAVYPRL